MIFVSFTLRCAGPWTNLDNDSSSCYFMLWSENRISVSRRSLPWLIKCHPPHITRRISYGLAEQILCHESSPKTNGTFTPNDDECRYAAITLSAKFILLRLHRCFRKKPSKQAKCAQCRDAYVFNGNKPTMVLIATDIVGREGSARQAVKACNCNFRYCGVRVNV